MILTSLVLLFGLSCNGPEIELTEDSIYYSKGFSEGFTIKLLKVTEFDKNGLPALFSDSTRVDLNYSGEGEIKDKILFYQDNKNYYWTYNLDSNYKTLPLKLSEGNWYGLWCGLFLSGFFGTDKHYFFINIDSEGHFHYFKQVLKIKL